MVLNISVNMSTRIENGSVIVTPPNSEAPIKSQRVGIKKSSVCSYYLSGKIKEVLEALEHLDGKFYLDLSATYHFCKEPLKLLIKNCSSFYRDGAQNIQKNLAYIEWIIENSPDDAFAQIDPPVFLSSKKYMKIERPAAKIDAFKAICVGDLFEIVFAHPQKGVFVLYAAPRANLGNALTSRTAFEKWFADNKIEL